jgi:hypothetical protein
MGRCNICKVIILQDTNRAFVVLVPATGKLKAILMYVFRISFHLSLSILLVDELFHG